jgi:23S rRNA pseudouridine2605 synthase
MAATGGRADVVDARERGVSLSRALSKLGILSRAQAKEAISAGLVSVNGRVITNPATRVVPERIRITVAGQRRRRAAWRTILFHKPRGVLTTRRDPEGRRTIYDVIGEPARGLIAVGRLDLATGGLLLLTSDTRLANWIADPANAVPRVYAVTVRGRVSADEAAGLDAPRIDVRKASGRETHLIVELRRGRNREVRRLFESVGHQVTRLKRLSVGGFTLDALAPGEWREVTREEVDRAFPESSKRRHRGATPSVPS